MSFVTWPLSFNSLGWMFSSISHIFSSYSKGLISIFEIDISLFVSLLSGRYITYFHPPLLCLWKTIITPIDSSVNILLVSILFIACKFHCRKQISSYTVTFRPPRCSMGHSAWLVTMRSRVRLLALPQF